MWLDSLGVKTVDEAAIKLAPLFTEFENRMRGIAFTSDPSTSGKAKALMKAHRNRRNYQSAARI
jgi:hypothetical protein